MKFRIFLSVRIMQMLLVYFILFIKLKGKCRVATQVQRLIFVQSVPIPQKDEK
jgi:hypothetical protein